MLQLPTEMLHQKKKLDIVMHKQNFLCVCGVVVGMPSCEPTSLDLILSWAGCLFILPFALNDYPWKVTKVTQASDLPSVSGQWVLIHYRLEGRGEKDGH